MTILTLILFFCPLKKKLRICNNYLHIIYLNGNKSDVSNYRSMVKLSEIPEVFEKLIMFHRYYHLINMVFKMYYSTTT